MPPRSYMVTAVVLAALVGVSFRLTSGSSIIVWYWLFAVAACVLAVLGALKVADGLRAAPWIGIALASPALVWAAGNLRELTSHMPGPALFVAAAYLALLVAAAGALRLVETMSRPHVAFGIGYALLVVAVLLMGVGLVALAMGWTFTSNAHYSIPVRAVVVVTAFVKYGAFIGAAVLIIIRRDVERWTAVVISLISAYMLYKFVSTVILLSVPSRGEGPMLLLQPVIMFVGGAAVWRMGSVLREQSFPGPSARLSPS